MSTAERGGEGEGLQVRVNERCCIRGRAGARACAQRRGAATPQLRVQLRRGAGEGGRHKRRTDAIEEIRRDVDCDSAAKEAEHLQPATVEREGGKPGLMGTTPLGAARNFSDRWGRNAHLDRLLLLWGRKSVCGGAGRSSGTAAVVRRRDQRTAAAASRPSSALEPNDSFHPTAPRLQ